jgi:ATP-dependent exoDNAse (exonuclease V) beta subunit
MKFPYPEISTITHNDGRWYDTPLGYYPSITTILGHTESAEKVASLKRWQDALGEEATRITQEAADRGTHVHLLAERYLQALPLWAPDENGNEIPEDARGMFKSLKLFLNKVDEVWGQEVALYSKTIEIAGRCDLIGVYEGIPAIIDFKTSRRLKGNDDIGNYRVQLAFYATAHNEMFGTDIQDGIILMSSAGFPQKFKVKIADHLPELRERAARYWTGAVNSST